MTSSAISGISRSVLARRLKTLVEHGILDRHRYQERPDRFEYRLDRVRAGALSRLPCDESVGRSLAG